MSEENNYTDINASYAAAIERSKKLEDDLIKNPKNIEF